MFLQRVIGCLIRVCVCVFQTSFWVVREILHAQTLKIRAEVLSLYIRTAKVKPLCVCVCVCVCVCS